MMQHAIRCKRTGKAIGMLLDGGECACPSADQCRERKETLPEFINRVVDGEEARRELMQKFDDTFRDVIANASKVIANTGKMTLDAVAAERERCAAYVEDYLRTWNDGKWADELAALIRKGDDGH